jgi:hypothetical protein
LLPTYFLSVILHIGVDIYVYMRIYVYICMYIYIYINIRINHYRHKDADGDLCRWGHLKLKDILQKEYDVSDISSSTYPCSSGSASSSSSSSNARASTSASTSSSSSTSASTSSSSSTSASTSSSSSTDNHDSITPSTSMSSKKRGIGTLIDLSDETSDTNRERILMQFSSIGTLKSEGKYLDELASSMSVKNTIKNPRKMKIDGLIDVEKPIVEIVWPTIDNVRCVCICMYVCMYVCI